jgi:hypothetical protein
VLYWIVKMAHNFRSPITLVRASFFVQPLAVVAPADPEPCGAPFAEGFPNPLASPDVRPA